MSSGVLNERLVRGIDFLKWRACTAIGLSLRYMWIGLLCSRVTSQVHNVLGGSIDVVLARVDDRGRLNSI